MLRWLGDYRASDPPVPFAVLRFLSFFLSFFREYVMDWQAMLRKHDAYENTCKCGELKLYFSPSAGG